MGHAAEKAAEILRGHRCGGSQLIQCDGLAVIFVDVIQHLAELKYLPVAFPGLWHGFQIEVMTEDERKEMIEFADHHHLISGIAFLHGLEDVIGDRNDGGELFSFKMIEDESGPVEDLLDIASAAGVVSRKHIQIKYQTFIDTVFGHAGMENASMNEDQVSGFYGCCALIQCHLQFSGENPDQLIFLMPVVVHDIPGVMAVEMIEGKGKIGGAVAALLVQIHKLHDRFLSEPLAESVRLL